MPAIVIADDDAVCRLFCAQALAPFDYQIHEASNGEESIQLTLQARPQVILLDLHMADMSGIKVLADVRRHWSAVQDEALLIGMTADDSGFIHASMLIAGFAHVLVKPFQAVTLRACIENAGIRLLETAHSQPPPQHGGKRASTTNTWHGVLTQLQTTFLAELGQHLSELDQLITALDWTTATHALHRLCGAAAMAGYLPLAAQARLLIGQFQHPSGNPALAQTYLDFLSQANGLLLQQTVENNTVIRLDE